MNEFLMYIKCEDTETILFYEERKVVIKENYRKVIEKELIKKLMTLNGVKDAIKQRWGGCYNIPIFISDKICFVKISKCIWVNYFQIKCLMTDGVVYLKNGVRLKTELKYRSLKMRIKKAERVIEEMVGKMLNNKN